MASIVKTVVATGVSSGLGLEAIRQLLGQAQAYNVILGARDTARTQSAYDKLNYDSSKHSLTVLPLELSNLKSVKTFAQQTLDKLGSDKIDYVLLNAALTGTAGAGPHGSKWCESYVVNSLSQHYLLHLLRNKVVESKARVVIVSSGAVRGINPAELDHDLKAEAGTAAMKLYSQTKFVQLLAAHWWRRQLADSNVVVAVSPGLIPHTGLGRGGGFTLPTNLPDAKSVPEGAASILAALDRQDLPADPDQIFLTSWGEWWQKDVYKESLDKALQDKWSPSKETIEKEENVA